MMLQISSGRGPVECELAVRLLFESLQKEFSPFEVVSRTKSRWCEGYASVVFRTEQDLSFLEGSVEWQCKSFLRPGHKRKNWFVDVAVIPDAEETTSDGTVRWQFFRSGGNGGQNVNKVETGVRLVHVQSGITVTCTEERSQSLNRQRALEKLHAILEAQKDAAQAQTRDSLWQRHTKLVRGDSVRVYEGKDFVRKR